MILHLLLMMEHLKTLPIDDSRVLQHMIPHKQFLDTYAFIFYRKIYMGDNNMVKIIGKGFVLIETHVNSRARSIRMYDMVHVPNLHSNLLFMSKLI